MGFAPINVVFLLGFGCLCLSFVPVCQGVHPGYVFERGPFYYKFVPQYADNRTFEEAQEICKQDENANLITIQDAQEMKWVGQVVAYMNYRDNYMGRLWLGATDHRIRLIYEYIDGTPFRYKTIPWLPGEPNRNRRLPFHHCLIMTAYNNKMAWGDEDCYMGLGYVCKGTGVPSRLTGERRVGYEFATNKFNYKFVPLPEDRLTWFEAKLYCEECETGNLLTIGSKEEDEYVTSVMQHLRYVIGFDKVWIGANDIWRTGNFSWSRPEDFVYSKWYDNTSLPVTRRSGDCVVVNTFPRLGLWTPENCILTLPFICKSRRCRGLTDIAFVVDRSGRVPERGFETIKQFIWQIVRLLPFDHGETKVALITYANKPTLIFDFPAHETPEEVHTAIQGAVYTGGGAVVQSALKLARYKLFSKLGKSRRGVGKIVVLITSGFNQPTKRDILQFREENFSLHMANVYRIVVGVGRRVARQQLQGFATTSKDIVLARSYKDLRRRIPTMRNVLCGRVMEIQARKKRKKTAL